MKDDASLSMRTLYEAANQAPERLRQRVAVGLNRLGLDSQGREHLGLRLTAQLDLRHGEGVSGRACNCE